ncbi:MAG: type II toxin-antitoxin system RatA family toxin [Burkholderiales bacterium]
MMTIVDRSMLVGYSAQQMYALVEDVESYPQFLPWCERAEVALREPGRTVATLHLNFHGLRQHFTTENANQPHTRIDMKLVSGTFRSLDGHWLFTALSEKACKVEFSLRYQFASRLLEKTAGQMFHRIADGFVEAFARRAEVKYGAT